jgi:hypothetical protein
MGKKIVIFVLLAVILAAALAEYFYVKSATEKLTASLEQVKSALAGGDEDAAADAAEQFSRLWNREKQRLEALFNHEEVDIISATAERIHSACVAGDRDDALAEVCAALFYVRHLREMIGIRWENIL